MRLAALLFTASILTAQCPVAVCDPTFTQFNADLKGALALTETSIKDKLQGRPVMTAQITPASSGWIASAPTTFGNAINTYSASLQSQLAISTQDVNLAFVYLTAASEYVGSATCPVGIDCAGMLAKYDAMFTQATSLGITMRVGLGGAGTTADDLLLSACGLSTPVSATGWEACTKPLMVAALTRWPQIDSIQVMEEPRAGLFAVLGHLLTVAETNTYITNVAAAIRAIPNATVKILAAVSGPSAGGSPWDLAYLTDAANGWLTASTGAYAALDGIVLDIFNGSCDMGTGNSVFPGLYYYSAMLDYWSANYTAAIRAAGKRMRVGQSSIPIWCPASGSTSGVNAYVGAGWSGWDTVWQSWEYTFTRWAASEGVESVAVYCTVPLLYFTADSTVANCNAGAYSALAMAQLGRTTAGDTYKSLAQWWRAAMLGSGQVSGRVALP